MPALLTSTFQRGNAPAAHSINPMRCDSLATSQIRVSSRGSLSLASRSFSSRRPQTITSLPADRKRSASARPIPEAPPVIRTVFDESSIESAIVP